MWRGSSQGKVGIILGWSRGFVSRAFVKVIAIVIPLMEAAPAVESLGVVSGVSVVSLGAGWSHDGVAG